MLLGDSLADDELDEVMNEVDACCTACWMPWPDEHAGNHHFFLSG